MSDPHTAGDLLCTAARRNDTTVMKELLRHGLNVDSKDRHGLTAIQIAMRENNEEMVELLVMNGAEVIHGNRYEFPSKALNEMIEKREVGHQITVSEEMMMMMMMQDRSSRGVVQQVTTCGNGAARVSIYRGHPATRRERRWNEAGRLIRLPNTMEELKSIASEKFGVDARKMMVTDEEGAEIDSVEVIRDNDKLFIVEETTDI